MKKTFSLLLLFLLFLSLYACNTPKTESEPNTSQEQSTETSPQTFLKQDDNKTFIILPISKEEIEVKSQYKAALHLVTYENIKSAEEQLTKELLNYSENSGFYLSKDSDGYLCLTVEIIKKIDPPNISEDDPTLTKGCNIDHEHIFLQERISTSYFVLD